MSDRTCSRIAGVEICIDYDTPQCGQVTRRFLRGFIIPEGTGKCFSVKFSSEKKLLKFGFTSKEEKRRDDAIGMSVEVGRINKNARHAVLPDMADQSTEVAEFILDNFLRICLQYVIPAWDGILLHSSAVVDGERSFIFVAPNSGGKSTIAGNTARQILSDDCVGVFRRAGDGVWMGCATPWGSVHTRGDYPVEAIFFIEKSDRFFCERIETLSAVKGLFANASFSFPDTEKHAGEILGKVLNIVVGMSNDVGVYRMGFRKDDNVMDLMKKKGLVWNSAVSTKR